MVSPKRPHPGYIAYEELVEELICWGWIDSLPRAIKRAALEWIKTAKTPSTRAARIAEVAGSAADGKRPKPFRR